ncbi:MAG: hypothetical protein Q4B82_08280 [Alysiella sp.]|uniref:hypothetical protein n=1 Tax=Alysiella sp. TaxID=1872483 RepID=UPI0026DACBF8|nr:hypothetical protein [Alysiella sp.]MDO4434558.1 hypothetical protein [Alysiella sp.]
MKIVLSSIVMLLALSACNNHAIPQERHNCPAWSRMCRINMQTGEMHCVKQGNNCEAVPDEPDEVEKRKWEERKRLMFNPTDS